MQRIRWTLPAISMVCATLIAAAAVWASETLTTHVSFHPDKLKAPTNVSATAAFRSDTTTVPSPLAQVVVYLPAGLRIDVRGAGTCPEPKLEAEGPIACPADSRIGFGGGTGALELSHEVIHERFTLDMFLGPSEHGRVVVFAYVTASSPVSFQLVVVAHEIQAPKPYGLGFTIAIPPIPTLPEASDASVETAFLTAGDHHVAYYKRVHGHARLVHVRGIVVPGRCPRGGFPYKAVISFADGTSVTSTGAIACPLK